MFRLAGFGKLKGGKPLGYIPSTQEIALPAPALGQTRAPALPECLTQTLEWQIKMQRLLLARAEGDKEVGGFYRLFQNKILWF